MNRLASFLRTTGRSTRKMYLVNYINRIEIIYTRTECEALVLEHDLIVVSSHLLERYLEEDK